MKNKEEFLFLYIVFKRRQKTEPKFLGEGSDKILLLT